MVEITVKAVKGFFCVDCIAVSFLLIFYVVSKYFKLNKADDSDHNCQEYTNSIGIAILSQLEGFFVKVVHECTC